ncbi:hypothetical protein [Rhodococcoides fascians]|uniref:hypothetical protein n=1 Tax=Rhodococcoides fascians TaxID=1828 RepID=UPI00117BDAB9|nr:MULTISPECIES: hypothetical protein [Rhodococcus]
MATSNDSSWTLLETMLKEGGLTVKLAKRYQTEGDGDYLPEAVRGILAKEKPTHAAIDSYIDGYYAN